MFSIIRKRSIAQVVRPFIAVKSTNPTAVRHLSKNPQNVRHSIQDGELQNCMVNRNQNQATLRSLSTARGSSKVFNDEKREFMALFPDIVQELTEKTKLNDHQSSIRFTKAMEYNVPKGKQHRGLLTVRTFKKLSAKDQLTPGNIRLAQYLGWCVEMYQGMALIIDDIMDKSLTRRGQDCWYKLDDIGMAAINDAFMIENSIYVLLRNHFRYIDYYTDLIDLFHDVIFRTFCGQCLDQLTATSEVAAFTMEMYNSIVANKSTYYSFYLPMALAFHVAGIKEAQTFTQSMKIFLEMGYFFQVQDDFLDCFGNPKVTGKIGTDIQDNKCSWLAVVCMEKASDPQKKIMAECYGQRDPAKIAQVKQLYVELGLPNAYATYEEESYNMIKTIIQEASDGFPGEVIMEFLNELYQRDV